MRSIGILIFASGSLPALAWGPEGHALIARIAEAQLTAAVQARVVEILGPGKTMASVASWADEVRRARPASAPWHYVDIPLAQAHLDMARDCPEGACIVAELDRLQLTLRDPATPADQRREALMFLIHFMGDLHQPLHCSDRDDKGGNSVEVLFHDRRSNLHSVWDSALLGRMGTEEQLFAGLAEESARHCRKWAKGNVSKWAEEGHDQARKIVYGKLPKTAEGQPAVLDAAYEQAADRLIRRQLELAGARLARVLSTVLQ